MKHELYAVSANNKKHYWKSYKTELSALDAIENIKKSNSWLFKIIKISHWEIHFNNHTSILA